MHPAVTAALSGATADRITKGLSAFWTQVFKDQGFVQGYANALALEMVALYSKLGHAAAETSLADTAPFDIVAWQPFVIRQADITTFTPTFGQGFNFGDTLPGVSPAQPLVFGKQVVPTASKVQLFAWAPPVKFNNVPTLVDCPINPTRSFTADAPLFNSNGTVCWTENPFSAIPQRIRYIDGEPVIILWLHNFEEDSQRLAKGYGTILGWTAQASSAYKDVLVALLRLRNTGPTVKAVTDLVAAAVGGSSADVSYIDYQTHGSWWRTPEQFGLPTNLTLPGGIFNGGVEGPLTFATVPTPVPMSDGTSVSFPVTGLQADVAAWYRWLNAPANVQTNIDALRVRGRTNVIVPVEFLMDEFLGSACGLLNVSVASPGALVALQLVMYTARAFLPKNALIIVKVSLTMPSDVVAPLDITDTTTTADTGPRLYKATPYVDFVGYTVNFHDTGPTVVGDRLVTRIFPGATTRTQQTIHISYLDNNAAPWLN